MDAANSSRKCQIGDAIEWCEPEKSPIEAPDNWTVEELACPSCKVTAPHVFQANRIRVRCKCGYSIATKFHLPVDNFGPIQTYHEAEATPFDFLPPGQPTHTIRLKSAFHPSIERADSIRSTYSEATIELTCGSDEDAVSAMDQLISAAPKCVILRSVYLYRTDGMCPVELKRYSQLAENAGA